MRIVVCVLLSCFVTALLAADEQKPKKNDERGKRNLEYSTTHHYSGPHSYRLERRISTAPQHSLYHPQFFPGPRPYSTYRKGRPYTLPAPPYAVQMEPLVHYSQRDPLYDTNIFSLNADGHNELTKQEDLLTENNHVHENFYGPPHQQQIVERPVYIKEPEPIIEIIIKESNVSLPSPPTTPPPKKKKEQVQVFYVKYKKNPNGHGKDSVIYDKPVPALTPHVHDEEDEAPEPEYHQSEVVTSLPPPSTTLRTVIKPDSEVYHSTSGVKVTFGKEGFDYDKRSSKPEDFHRSPVESRQQFQFPPVPQGRQLSSFSNTYFKRAPISNPNFQSGSNFRPDQRQPQPYHPFNQSPPQQQFKSQSQAYNRPPQTFSTPPKYPFQSPPYTKPNTFSSSGNFPNHYQQTINHPSPQAPQYQASLSHPTPTPPQFNQNLPQIRKPVPYKPFDNLKPQSQIAFPTVSSTSQHHNQHQSNPQNIQFRPETHFHTHQQLPQTQSANNFNHVPISQQLTTHGLQINQQNLPQSKVNQQFRNEDLNSHEVRPHEPQQQVRFQPEVRAHPEVQQHFHQQQHQIQPHLQQELRQNQPPHLTQELRQNQQPQSNFQHQEHHFLQQPQEAQFNQQFNQHISNNEHIANLQHAQNILPPGGQLIHSVPKFEQHISVIEPNKPQALPLEAQANQFLSPQEFKQKIRNQFVQRNVAVKSNAELNEQETHKQQQQQYYHPDLQHHQLVQQQPQTNVYPTTEQPQSSIYHTTKKITTTTQKPTTTKPTTQKPDKSSTTTKDPKLLNAQLPDEVPDDLREQLLSSGILNNADISVLDYDKVGDIPLSALPPDQLANFYNAGGAQQIGSGSEPIPSVVDKNGKEIHQPAETLDQISEGSEIDEIKSKDPVEMKVVHYDPDSDQGQQVQESYVKDDATQVDPVVLNDNTYNRYLPLKVNGTQFPIPDVPELKDKQISSVVVLAPIAYDFSSSRKTRQAADQSEDIDLIEGDSLKQLLQNPSRENYKKFLENENKTRTDKQSVILLVTGSKLESSKDKEIFMYDVATQTVSKLSGELSSAFVDAAEANSKEDKETEEGTSVAAASNIVETVVPFEGEYRHQSFRESDVELEGSPVDLGAEVPIIDPMDGDLDTQASEQLESFVDISGLSVNNDHDDLTASASDYSSVHSMSNNLSGHRTKTGQS